jgi:hypothetical protein
MCDIRNKQFHYFGTDCFEKGYFSYSTNTCKMTEWIAWAAARNAELPNVE